MAFTLATPSGPVMVPTTADWLSQAHVGTTDTPAIFTHEDNKLVLQNGTPSENNRIVLGRHRVEDRSLHPKNVHFQPEEQSLGDVRLEMDNDRGRVSFSSILFLSLFTAWFSGAN